MKIFNKCKWVESAYNRGRLCDRKGVGINMYIRRVLTASVMLLLLSRTVLLHAATIDATLFTTYTMDAQRTNLDWVVWVPLKRLLAVIPPAS